MIAACPLCSPHGWRVSGWEEKVKERIVKYGSTDQYDRYVAMRRSTLKTATVKGAVEALIPPNLLKPHSGGCEAAIVRCVQVTGKLFVRDLVEVGRTVMDERGEAGALRPEHIQEAYRRLLAEDKVVHLPASHRDDLR